MSDAMKTRLYRRDLKGATMFALGALVWTMPAVAQTREAPAANEDNREIVVTAQKREQNLQDVPVPVTALAADDLVSQNQLNIQSFASNVPGLSVTPSDSRGAPVLAIRGISTGDNSNPTVGITIDDTPSGSSTYAGGGWITPDIDPSDLQRVEVLRGPQGTLYGASSLGGLVRYITVDPSTDRFSGRFQAGINTVENADRLGFNVRGSVNLPLGEIFAVRASAVARVTPGYIDNIGSATTGRGERGVNWGEAVGGRVSALLRPSENFSIKLAALVQRDQRHGSSYVYDLPSLGDLEQSSFTGTGGYDKKIQSYTANINARVGEIDITSVTGYGINRGEFVIDYSSVYGPDAIRLYGVPGAPINNVLKTRKVSQEVRVLAPIGEAVEILAGGFYTDEKSRYTIDDAYAADPVTGERVGQLYFYEQPTRFREFAIFGDVTVNFSDRFNVQIGGRQSWIRQTNSAIITGPLFGDFPTPETRTKADAFTYLITPQFKLNSDVMLYARFASGYRPGGLNPNYILFGVPAEYDPDTTRNYEVGVKADLLDKRLTLDASLYHIDWSDVQITLNNTAFSGTYLANAGKAKSQGVELSLNVRPFDGTQLSGWFAYNNAELTENFPISSTVVGRSGDRLPFNSRYSGSISLDQRINAGNAELQFGAKLNFVSARYGNFKSSPVRNYYPGYATLDLRAGARVGDWDINLFVNNVTDKRALLVGGNDAFPTNAYGYIEPRTAGILAGIKF